MIVIYNCNEGTGVFFIARNNHSRRNKKRLVKKQGKRGKKLALYLKAAVGDE